MLPEHADVGCGPPRGFVIGRGQMLRLESAQTNLILAKNLLYEMCRRMTTGNEKLIFPCEPVCSLPCCEIFDMIARWRVLIRPAVGIWKSEFRRRNYQQISNRSNLQGYGLLDVHPPQMIVDRSPGACRKPPRAPIKTGGTTEIND